MAVINQDIHPLKIHVSLPALKGLVRDLAGSHADVQSLVTSGQNEETFEPTIQQMSDLSKSRLYFSAGLPFEVNLIPKLRKSMKNLAIVDLRQSFGGGELSSRSDPHFWTSLRHLQVVVGVVEKVLSEARPSAKEHFARQAAALLETIRKTDSDIRKTLTSLKERSFFVYHPSWSAFAADYNLNQIAIEAHGHEPGAKSIEKLLEQSRQSKVKVRHIFVQQGSQPKAARAFAESLGAEVAVVDAIGDNYLQNLKDFAEKIAKTNR